MAVVELERPGSAESGRAVGALPTGPPAGMSTERLEAEVRTLTTRIAAATCHWLLMVAELDRRGAYAQWECRSMAAWLSWHCSMSLRTANEHVRVARALEHLPTTTALFAAGELSYSKVRALSRVADPSSEAELAAVARSLTAAMLDETCGSVARIHREVELGRDAAQQARRGVHFHEHDDGTVTITARVTPDVAELIGNVLDQLLACDGGLRLSLERDGRTFDVGRRTRRAAAALRRKSMAAHHHRCAFPGCNSTRHLHLHHIRSWLDGGPTDAENLLPLCHFHHRAVHERGWRITVRSGGTVTATSRRDACVDGFLNATRAPVPRNPGPVCPRPAPTPASPASPA